MVAGSLSMWVRMEAISGTSRRMSDSSWVTRSWAARSGMVSSTSRCCSRWRRSPWLLDGDVVNGEVGAGGDGADAVVDAFGEGGGGDGVDDDVGVRGGGAGRRRWRPW